MGWEDEAVGTTTVVLSRFHSVVFVVLQNHQPAGMPVGEVRCILL